MACILISLYKRLGVSPVGIGETFRRAIAKLIMRAVGDQAKIACGSIQLCTGLESDIEGATDAVAQRQQERHAPDPGVGSDKGLEGAEDESAVEMSGRERTGEAERFGEIVEIPRPPGERSTAEGGERG